MEHSKTGTLQVKMLKDPVPDTEAEIEVPYGTILIKRYQSYKDTDPFEDSVMSAVLLLPGSIVKHYLKDDNIEIIPHNRLYTLQGYDILNDPKHIEHIYSRILTSLRMNLAYVLAYNNNNGSKTKTD